MRTPRPGSTRRGITTLIGNGWLHEAPKNIWPREWDIRGKSALRKCMFLPAHPMKPGDVPVSPAAMPVPRGPAKHDTPFSPRRRNPEKDVRVMTAVSPEDVLAAQRRALYADEKAKVLAELNKSPRRWYEDPVALGSLLILLPPIGLATLWSSKRYSSDARWALTVMTALMMCLAAAITVAVIALR
jgi:hypothetical protein